MKVDGRGGHLASSRLFLIIFSSFTVKTKYGGKREAGFRTVCVERERGREGAKHKEMGWLLDFGGGKQLGR